VDLRSVAAADLATTVEGDGVAVIVTDPDGASAELTGLAADVGALIDPETDTMVSGRQATVTLRVASLTAAGMGVPVGIAETASKPWRITVADVEGTTHDFAVGRAFHDRTIGVVTCMLEGYDPT